MSLFDDVKKNLIEWYNVTSEKTTEVARVSTRKYDKFGISRDIERQFSELGSLVYNALNEGRPDVLDDEGVAALVERIMQLEKELRAKDEEIDSIRQEYANRKAAAETEADRAQSAGAAATVIVDPELRAGHAESPILIEPTEVAESENEEGSGPEKNS